MKKTGIVIFHAPSGESVLEQQVNRARIASVHDLLTQLQNRVDACIIVCSCNDVFEFETLNAHIIPTQDSEIFHFGRHLQQVIREHALDSVIYFGSGSGTLLSEEQFADLFAFSQRADASALFNNYYSCDFAVFADAKALLPLHLPERDNGIGFLLADSGIHCHSLPRSLASQFDLDTPIDLVLLKAAGHGGPRIRAFLDTLDLSHPTLDSLSPLLAERTALVYLVGRVSPVTWQAFERQVACRTAGMIEGRGMKAYADRQPPVLSSLFSDKGFSEFFHTLEDSSDGAIIDTRPLLARQGQLPDPHERFSSDLFDIPALRDPRWVEFTQQALTCKIPILLGGHSLVSGGLYLLSEICWKGRDLPRRLHPDPYKGDGRQHESESGQTSDRH